jgi:hypothetical protein
LQNNGATIGVLALYQRKAGAFSSEDMSVLNACCENFAKLLALQDAAAPILDFGLVYKETPEAKLPALQVAH